MKDAGMSTQMVVHLEIAPFAEQVEIDLAQCAEEAVGIFEFDEACGRLASQPIAEGVAMVGAQQRLDLPAIAELELRWFADHAGRTMSGRFGFRRAQGSSLL